MSGREGVDDVAEAIETTIDRRRYPDGWYVEIAQNGRVEIRYGPFSRQKSKAEFKRRRKELHRAFQRAEKKAQQRKGADE